MRRLLDLPRWKQAALSAAVCSVIVGGVVTAASGLGGGERGQASNVSAPGARSLTDGGPALRDRPPAEGGAFTDYSPALMKGGLSFIVGFSIGFAARTFLKLSALILGIVLAINLGLYYGGYLTIDWHALERDFERLAGHFQGQFSGFRDFITGSLPAAGMAGLGLLTGLKKG